MLLIARALGGLAFLLAAIAAVIFLSAGTLSYPQGWTFLVFFGTCVLLVTLYLIAKDQALLERRTRAGPTAETDARQKAIQAGASMAFIAIFIVSSIDHRFGWTHPASWVERVGDALVALGLFVVWLVFRENTFTAGTIEVAPNQKVISTGPYSLMRHPMYSGAFIMLTGTPLALGSYWGLVPVGVLMLIIIARLLQEERFLAASLPGYSAYLGAVRIRLAPFIW